MTLDEKKGVFKDSLDDQVKKVDLKEVESQSADELLVGEPPCQPDAALDLQLKNNPENNDQQPQTEETQSSRLQLTPADLRRGEIVIPYQPFASTEKWVKYRFSSMSVPKAWFALVLVVLFFTFNGPDAVQNLHFLPLESAVQPQPGMFTIASESQSAGVDSGLALGLFFGGILAFISASAFLYYRQPTHVVLTENGLSLQWRRKSQTQAVTLPWSKVERIDLAWPAGKTSPQDCMIKFKGSSVENITAEYPIVLKLGAIAKEEDRDKLLRALESWAPDIHRDAQLLEILTPAQDHSYTELWLQALSAPPKRERLTPLSPGSRLQESRYEVYDQLGVGGQGTAYLAMDHKSMDEVVLKEFILPVYVDTNVRRQALERMQNEAAMLRKLDNNRIVRLWDFFVEDHRGYLVLEKIDGVSLQQLVESKGKQSESEVQSLALQMCEMLSYLHGLNPSVIHRDFTPDNLILNKDGTLKLVDFNVAQQTEATATGTVVGKHAYISPEQFRGRPTPQSDLYSMGATLFYLLTGEAPEPIRASHPKSQRPDASDEIDAIVARATAFDTKKRYQNVEELKNDLKALK
jgi:tRNA A-37 threonylcarbamoyl transferase component Bud32